MHSLRRTASAVVTIFALACIAAGCGEKVDPTDPEGAFNLYAKALLEGDGEGVWARLAPSSHQYFDDQLKRLHQMDGTIEKYLPQTDHRLARNQAGSILTDSVKDGKGFFLAVFNPQGVKVEESYRVGLIVEEIQMTEDGKNAQLTTLGGEKYVLTKGENEEWFVMLIRSTDAVATRMAWVDANESALKQTVEDLIAEERKKREAIISELMKLE